MNFPGKSINELVLEEPETDDNDEEQTNGHADNGDNEESDEDEGATANTNSTKNRGLYTKTLQTACSIRRHVLTIF